MLSSVKLPLLMPPACLLAPACLLSIAGWAPAAEPSSSVRGDARHAVSPNFSVHSEDPSHPADRVAVQCERRRQHQQRRWLGESGSSLWRPRCEVVVHANENAYLRCLGARAAMTRGVSRIHRQSHRIVSRHISLMADPQSGELTALAHELTHLVLADRFKMSPPPRWVDEGTALLADDAKKQWLHLRDLRGALSNHCCPSVREALAMRHYPPGTRRTAFYGLSLSLVGYLCELDDPAKVVDLAVLGNDCGYDAALREIYGIANTAELQRRWQRYLRDQPGRIAQVR